MFLRLRFFSTTIASSVLLFLVLCLGSQNNKNPEDFFILNLIVDKSVSLPSGYWVGGAIVFGVLTGGSTAALIFPVKDPKQTDKSQANS